MSTGFGWGKGGNVTSAGWQVTLCDPMWHVSSRSGVATLRTVIHLLVTYLSGRSVLLPRDAGTIAIALCLSVCLSVTSRCSIETVEQIGFLHEGFFDLSYTVF